MTMLSPLPKSTVISPGTPRNACITRRWIFSFTGTILEELTNRLRPVHGLCLQDFLKTSGEVRRKIIQRFEQLPKKLMCVRPVHWQLSSPGQRANVPEAYEERFPDVNRAVMTAVVHRCLDGEPAATESTMCWNAYAIERTVMYSLCSG